MKALECEPVGIVEREEGLEHKEGKEEIFSYDDFLRSKEAKISIFEKYCEALEGIRKGTLIWVIWYAHLVKDRPLKVHPFKDPKMPELGVFATRSPARPCPIGLSLCYVVSVDGCELKVKGLDAVDGTPVIDLKLYSRGLDDPREVLALARG
ncbi:methyltransferase [Ignicoccus pacificus DSM 13166]|uniref:Methyltransferase n=1 Tax=Ignicoccus pacificus DSM 13166 TaxID=940294 RepID=A0A977KA09_9CREN|nr:methyltransferase [Ignicoccus pacificus DSM 13166]